MIQKLINNPFFRIIGIGLILYYGLFANKEHPDSLGNRLAPERVKENIHDMSIKSMDIMINLRKAEELAKTAPPQNQDSQPQENQVLENTPLEQQRLENQNLQNQNTNNGNAQ